MRGTSLCPHCGRCVLDAAKVSAAFKAVQEVGELRAEDGDICAQLGNAHGRMLGRLDDLIFSVSISTYCTCAAPGVVEAERDAA